MRIDQFLEELWNSYTRITPSAGAISDLFSHWGEMVRNDHISIRTFNDPRINVTIMARPFTDKGYKQSEKYWFEGKAVRVASFGHPDQPELPAVFIIELKLEAFSKALQETVFNTLRDTPRGIFNEPDLILRGRIWGMPSYDIYETIRQESEYAAWVYVFGFCVNQFAVSVNALRNFGSLQQVNTFLQSNGFCLNTAGGLIKGGPDELMEQSATLADRVNVHFREGNFMIPGCDYAFALRYPDLSGQLYPGYIAASADKISGNTGQRYAGRTVRE
jgi:2-oxoadipate dioxygenase/decarboxylase-like protein